MRKIDISAECKNYFEKQNQRVEKKFYELRIKAGNEYRVVIFAYDHSNIIQSKKIILLNAFLKKSNKDYKKAISEARKILNSIRDEEE